MIITSFEWGDSLALPENRRPWVKGSCRLSDCDTKEYCKGYCRPHYVRFARTGSPERESDEERFWSKVEKTTTCWLWTGALSGSGGYGNCWYDGRVQPAHRVSYTLSNGKIPDSVVVDHHYECPKNCVNPKHLRKATTKQNMENISGLRPDNISGHRGVKLDKKRNVWIGTVNHNKKPYRVGTFPAYELHIAGYKTRMKRNELYTHNDKDRG